MGWFVANFLNLLNFLSASGVTAGTLNHDCKIDWLELNPHASHLLFRDKKQQLHLFNLITQVPLSLSQASTKLH
jgi:hypothetical protein